MRTLGWFGLIMVALILCACAQAPRVQHPIEQFPDDGYIDVTVLVRRAHLHASSPFEDDAHRWPARYVVFADGTLRFGLDPVSARGINWLPPVVRRLCTRELQHLWRLAQQLGLNDPESGDDNGNVSAIVAQRGERVYVLAFAGAGARWMFVRRAPVDHPSDAAMANFVQHLAELAGAEDAAIANRIAPHRYDFGPDPYARYRTQP